MGRYDKIRYWNGSSWVQPNQIRVWNGSSWVDYGTNDSSNTKSIYAWNGSSWVRKTLNRTVHYGDKEWYCSASGGAGTFNVNSGANVNQNKFNFYFYVNKDYDNDKNVATFSNTSHGWSITWLADGRMRWSTYWSGTGYHSYSSNYIGAYNWCYIQVWSDSTGTGAGNMSFNGTWASANRSGRHQWGGQTLTLGTWGMMYRGDMHSYGIDGGGSYCDYWSNVNNYTVGWADVTENNVYRNGNTRVTQDTWVTWD